MKHRLYAALSAAFAIYLLSGVTLAQEKNVYTNPTDGVLLLSPSITETVDATAISINPA